MAKGKSQYARWSSDPEKNEDAKTLYDGFLEGRWSIDNPPDVKTIMEIEPKFAKYDPKSFKNHIASFRQKAEMELLRRKANGMEDIGGDEAPSAGFKAGDDVDDDEDFDVDDDDGGVQGDEYFIPLPNEVFSWRKGGRDRVTARVHLLTGLQDLSKEFRCMIHPGGRKVTLYFKRNPNLDLPSHMQRGRNNRARYPDDHAKIVAYEEHISSKREYESEEKWNYMHLSLPIRCEEELCGLEGHDGVKPTDYLGYRELELEFMGHRSNTRQTGLCGGFEDLSMGDDEEMDPDLGENNGGNDGGGGGGAATSNVSAASGVALGPRARAGKRDSSHASEGAEKKQRM